MPPNKQPKSPSSSPRVSIDLIKSPSFRSIHVDGMYGGLTPHGYIAGAIYNERAALPQHIEHELTEDQRLGKEVAREGKKGIVRELEINLFFDEVTARSVAEWLLKRADELKARKEAVLKATTGKKKSKRKHKA